MMEFLAFRLDTVNQCLWCHTDSGKDECIRLSPKPFALLRYLVEHPGRLVTEAEILEAVWPKLYVQPESVKTQLYEIRKVLRDDAKTPRYISTVPRLGYQFIAPVNACPPQTLAGPPGHLHRRLVGREQELTALREHLGVASRGLRQVVFISGDPGIGKTALADEFERRTILEVPDLRIAQGHCIEAHQGTEAYYPILEALGQLCVGSSATPIIEILAAQAPTWLVQFPALLTERLREVLSQEILGATRERMLREICSALEMIAANTPLLLLLEDLQWVDRSTVDVISAFARRRSSAKLLLIATSRPVDILPPGHPFKVLKQDLLLRQPCDKIDLKPLVEPQIAEYLGIKTAQGDSSSGLVEWVSRRSGGNPLFMLALLDHLTQNGLVDQERGSWKVSAPLEEIDLGVPETLRQMIETQIELLSEDEQRALEAASVQGIAFSASICAPVINEDAEAYENLYAAMAHGRRMVRAIGTHRLPDGTLSTRYEFVHALYRDVMYHRQSPLRLKKLHKRIGGRLESVFSERLGDVALELARHCEEGSEKAIANLNPPICFDSFDPPGQFS